MGGYKAGDLSLSIQAISKDALSSLDLLHEKLQTIVPLLEQVTKSTIAGKVTKGQIKKPLNKSWTEKQFNTTKLGKEYLSMSKSVTKTGKAVESTTSYFNEQGKEIKKIIYSVDEYGNKITKTFGGNKSSILNMAKWAGVYTVARRLGRVVAGIIQDGADYTETLNLWSVAMGKNIEQATTFVNKMNEAYGISKTTLMNAQATFKNMLNSLGQISETMAYTLSEGITQMALDYSSLYNVSMETAMTKFQAVLAGQVRPIRSVSGYDITENTLYQLYQSLGGTKSVRNLSRTEKQLLSIFAVFKQMDRSGAIGDMERTIESFANQSRIMAERWKDVRSYSGLVLVDLIETSGVMKGVNTVLSYMGGFFEAMATYMGAIKTYGQGDPLSGLEENASSTLDTIEEIQGKLLGFDKFRVLGEANGDVDTDADVDTKLISALGSYEGMVDKAKEKTTNIATEWLKILGITKNSETGVIEYTKKTEGLFKIWGIGSSMISGFVTIILGKAFIGVLTKIISSLSVTKGLLSSTFSLKNIGIMALVSAFIYLYQSNEEFKNSIDRLFGALMNLVNVGLNPLNNILSVIGNTLGTLLNAVAPILTFIANVVAGIIEFLNNAGLIEPLIWGILTAIAVFKFTNWINGLISMFSTILSLISNTNISIQSLTKTSQLAMTAGIGLLIAGIASLANAWGDMGGWQRAITIITALTVAIIGAWVAIKAFSMSAPVAIGLGAALAGGVLLVGSQLAKNSVTKFADGGMPDKGTMFLAGEAGAEIVYNNSNGQSGVVNIQQIQSAFYGALSDWSRDYLNSQFDRTRMSNGKFTGAVAIYESVKAEANRRGDKAFSKT